MLGKRSAQLGLFEADTLYTDFVGRRTFYGYLAAERGELFDDGTSPRCTARTMDGRVCHRAC